MNLITENNYTYAGITIVFKIFLIKRHTGNSIKGFTCSTDILLGSRILVYIQMFGMKVFREIGKKYTIFSFSFLFREMSEVKKFRGILFYRKESFS